jgi:hypothetical protein
MNEVCTNRLRFSHDEAADYIARISPTLPRDRVSYVVADSCATCRCWHLRTVERALQLAS